MFVRDLFEKQLKIPLELPVPVRGDNAWAIRKAHPHRSSSPTRVVMADCEWVKEEDGKSVRWVPIPSSENFADSGTKPNPKVDYQKFCEYVFRKVPKQLLPAVAHE